MDRLDKDDKDVSKDAYFFKWDKGIYTIFISDSRRTALASIPDTGCSISFIEKIVEALNFQFEFSKNEGTSAADLVAAAPQMYQALKRVAYLKELIHHFLGMAVGVKYMLNSVDDALARVDSNTIENNDEK